MRPYLEFDLPFEELPLGGFISAASAREWTYAAHADGIATIRVTAEDWCLSDISLDSFRRGDVGEPYWVRGSYVLPIADPLFPLVRAAIETRLGEAIQAEIAKRLPHRFGRAA